MAHRIFRRTFAVFYIAALIFIAASALYPPVFLTALGAVRGAAGCPPSEVWRGTQMRVSLDNLTKDWRLRIRLLKDDPAGFRLWATPDGDVWIPSDSEGSLAALLAQQSLAIYAVGGRGVKPGDSFLNEPGSAGVPVGVLPLTTMDNIAAENHIGRVHLIKMDIKGAAPRAIAGAAGLIRRHKPRIVVAFEDGDTPEPVDSALRSITPDYRRVCGMCVLLDWRAAPVVGLYY